MKTTTSGNQGPENEEKTSLEVLNGGISGGKESEHHRSHDHPHHHSHDRNHQDDQNHHVHNFHNHQRIDFLQDPPRHMTMGRRIALWLARTYPSLYDPNGTADKDPQHEDHVHTDQKPSLEIAWAFFEHVTLARYIVREKQSNQSTSRGMTLPPPPSEDHIEGDLDSSNGVCEQDDNLQAQLYNYHYRQAKKAFRGERKMTVAEPGESYYKTKLYPIISTPLSQLGDFGLGFGLYFATIRAYALLALLGGILSIPNIMYFASSEYDYNQQEGVPTLLKGSAICTNRTWVPCPTCSPELIQKGAYPIERVLGAWYPAPATASVATHLNVTDYLVWNSEPESYWDVDNNQWVVNLTDLVEADIPEEYGISLNASHGYILNGVSVTGRLGYTPLVCREEDDQRDLFVRGCYLDIYPLLFSYQDYLDYLEETGGTSPPGDIRWVYVGAALRNNCDGATLDQGFYNYGAVLIMILGTIFISQYIKQAEVEFDEDEQTAQDYSVIVQNPPPDAHNPEEWKAFFEEAFSTEVENFKVTVCTVDVANKPLMRHLLQRREILKQLETELFLPPLLSQGGAVVPLDLATIEEHIQQRDAQSEKVSKKTTALLRKLKNVEALVRGFYFDLSGTKPPTTKVYLTFETEAAQRHVLSKLTVGKLTTHGIITKDINPRYLFRGEHALQVQEPEEPSTIRWEDLDVSEQKMLFLRVATYMVTMVLIVAAYFAVRELYLNNQPWFASILVSIFTSTFPIIAKALAEIERHHSETSLQRWLFLKICVFNVLVTTVLLSLITPFQATLDKRESSLPGLIPAVYSLFYSQMVITPLVQLVDIGGNIKRHFLAPRAKTQHQMNMCMIGTQVHLAERYSNMIKFLFMTLWYCSIYPAAFFLGFISLMMTYFVDRFSLMRSWARSGQGKHVVAPCW